MSQCFSRVPCHLLSPGSHRTPSLGGSSTRARHAADLTSKQSRGKKRARNLRGIGEAEKDSLEKGKGEKGVAGVLEPAGESGSWMEHMPPPLWLGLTIAEGYRGITDMGLSSQKISCEMQKEARRAEQQLLAEQWKETQLLRYMLGFLAGCKMRSLGHANT